LPPERVGVNGVLPDLIRVGRQVDLGITIIVEDAALLGVEVADQFVVLVVVEEGLVGADDFLVLDQALAHTGTEFDEAFDAIRRDEGVAKNLVRLLADTINTAGALDQTDDGPGQVVVDDDVRSPAGSGPRKARPSRSARGAHPLVDLVAFSVGLWREAPRQRRGVRALAGSFSTFCDAKRGKLGFQVTGSVGELREDQQFVLAVWVLMSLASSASLASRLASHSPQA
jgi:hypothetical protein